MGAPKGKITNLLLNRPNIILYITFGATLIVLISIFGPRIFIGDDSDSVGKNASNLDPSSAEFYLSDRGISTGVLAKLSDGLYHDSSTGMNVRLVDDSVESSVDLDSNGSIDIVAVLEWTGVGAEPYDSWRSINAWLNLDGSFVPYEHPLAWEWNCAGPDQGIEEVFPSDITISWNGGIGSWRQTSNTCGDDIPDFISRTGFSVAIVDGYPVQTSPSGYRTSSEQCGRSKEQYGEPDFIKLPNDTELHVFPASDAPLIQTGMDNIEAMAVWKSDLTSDRINSWNGYLPVSVVVQFDIAYCAWVPSEVVPDLTD